MCRLSACNRYNVTKAYIILTGYRIEKKLANDWKKHVQYNFTVKDNNKEPLSQKNSPDNSATNGNTDQSTYLSKSQETKLSQNCHEKYFDDNDIKMYTEKSTSQDLNEASSLSSSPDTPPSSSTPSTIVDAGSACKVEQDPKIPLSHIIAEAIKQSIAKDVEQHLPAEWADWGDLVAERAACAVMKVPCIEAFSEIRNQLHMRNISKREEWNDKEEKLEDFLDRVYPETKIAGGMIPNDFQKIDKRIFDAMNNGYKKHNKENPNDNRSLSYYVVNTKTKNLDRLAELSKTAFDNSVGKIAEFFTSLRLRREEKPTLCK